MLVDDRKRMVIARNGRCRKIWIRQGNDKILMGRLAIVQRVLLLLNDIVTVDVSTHASECEVQQLNNWTA